MAETPPCRRWGAMNVLMRLKNKIREKFFWDRILIDPPADDISSTSDSAYNAGGHIQHDDDSSTNHQTLQYYYFDAMDGTSVSEGAAPQTPQFATSKGPTYTQMLQGDTQEDFLTLADFDMDDGLPAQMDTHHPYQNPPVYAEYGCAEEYVDARMELPETSVQNNFYGLENSYNSAAATPQLGRVETTEMMDTGDSNSATLMPAQWQQIMLLRQFLEIDGVVRAGAGWRVVLSIVSAFRRISGLVRIRRSQRSTSGEITPVVSTLRRIGPSTRYKGIRFRNGKWVSEIRITGTLEKVWLGSYNTHKEAALAFDAGKHHCSTTRKSRNFNFVDSPRLLGAPENLLHLSSVDRRMRIKHLAENHARTYGNANIR